MIVCQEVAVGVLVDIGEKVREEETVPVAGRGIPFQPCKEVFTVLVHIQHPMDEQWDRITLWSSMDA